MFWEDVMIPVLVIGGLFVALIAIVTAPVMMLTAASCSSQASKMGLEHSWGPLQDCMINVDGKWMLLESYKVVKLRAHD